MFELALIDIRYNDLSLSVTNPLSVNQNLICILYMNFHRGNFF